MNNIAPKGSALDETLLALLAEALHPFYKLTVTQVLRTYLASQFPFDQVNRVTNEILADFFNGDISRFSDDLIADILAQAIFDYGQRASATPLERQAAAVCLSSVGVRQLPFMTHVARPTPTPVALL